MKNIIFILGVMLIAASCKKATEVDRPTGTLTDSVTYLKNATATAVVTGAIQTAMLGFSGGSNAPSSLGGMSADELDYMGVDGLLKEISQNGISTANNITARPWARAYNVIYICNVALEGINASRSADLTEPVRAQLIGEAKYMRAFMYFYLVNFFGDVPLILQSDFRINMQASRTPKAQVYQQIIADLTEAKELLTVPYKGDNNGNSNFKNRPNKAAATAMLARVYLYTGEWQNAEVQADEVINNTVYGLETDLTKVFLTASKEAIWQMEEGVTSITTQDANWFLPQLATTGVPTTPILSASLIGAFGQGDLRKSNWIGSVTSTPATGSKTYLHPFKYKVRTASTTEKTIVLRLAEQYLIRAEARIQQPAKLQSGISDLNIIRRRAFGFPLNESSTADLPETMNLNQAMASLEQERRLELFTEWAHRWFDLKRWKGVNNSSVNRVDEVMPNSTLAKGGTWNTNMQLYPIPQNDRSNNAALTQNPGYSN